MLLTLWLASVICFVVIQLPPGDFVTSHVTRLELSGMNVSEEEILQLQKMYGLGQSPIVQYYKWVTGCLRGDLGYSFAYNISVTDLIVTRLPFTISFSFVATILSYIIALSIGVFTAYKHNSLFDKLFSVIGWIGLAVPQFLIALILMWGLFKFFSISIGGLFSPEYLRSDWGLPKLISFVKHMIAPIFVIALSETPILTRIVRGQILDEIKKPYVLAARSRGVPEIRAIIKYPLRVTLVPLASYLGWVLPSLVSGTTILSIIMNLPTVGALLPSALLSQDMYLAGGILLILISLTIIGMFISDILIYFIDPRSKAVFLRNSS